MSKAQKILDSLEYPPNHKYKIEGLRPGGKLAERFGLLNEVASGFFEGGRRFLDVGCNKGFFSLYAARTFEQVVGIDTGAYIPLWNELKPSNMQFVPETFQRYTPMVERFDRIFFGNVHYKFWQQWHSWDWVAKLATFSSGQVLIEGPVDRNEPLLLDLPIFDDPDFTFDRFMDQMGKYFVLRTKVSHKQIKGRWIMLFERKPSPLDDKIQLATLRPFKRLIAESVRKKTQVYEMDDGRICKLGPWFDQQMRFDMAQMSPMSTLIDQAVYAGTRWVGWIEKPIDRKFVAGEQDVEVFRRHCYNQIFYLRNGYLDFDPATINFGLKDDEMVCFDKDAVLPFRDVLSDRIFDYCDRVIRTYYPRIWKRKDVLTLLRRGFQTGRAAEMVGAFEEVLSIL